jgi:hypothetical protein
LRERDSNAAEVVSDYLDRIVYPKLFERFERITNAEEQRKGIDIIAQYAGRTILVDEKAAVHYLTRRLDTFVLELSFSNRNGERMLGWFIEPSMRTGYYVFAWPRSSSQSLSSFEQVDSCEAVLLSKDALIRFLEDRGLSMEAIRLLALQDPDVISEPGVIDRTNWGEGVSLRVSTHLSEKPMNLIVSKKHLISIAEQHVVLFSNDSPNEL